MASLRCSLKDVVCNVQLESNTIERVTLLLISSRCGGVVDAVIVVVPIAPTIITRCYDFIRARPARKSRDPQTSNTEVCPTNVSSSVVVVVVVIVVVPIAPTIITCCYDFIRARRARKSRDLQMSNTEVCPNVSSSVVYVVI